MKAHFEIQVAGKSYHKGDELPKRLVYPFFLFHMLAFGFSGFLMAYADDGPALSFLYMHGGLAIVVYLVFYFGIFGVDKVKWMFINAGLGLLGIYTQIEFILSLFGKRAADFPWYVHLVPFMYYILYTFLLYQLVLELTGAHQNAQRKKTVEGVYVISSVLVYGGLFLFGV